MNICRVDEFHGRSSIPQLARILELCMKGGVAVKLAANEASGDGSARVPIVQGPDRRLFLLEGVREIVIGLHG